MGILFRKEINKLPKTIKLPRIMNKSILQPNKYFIIPHENSPDIFSLMVKCFPDLQYVYVIPEIRTSDILNKSKTINIPVIIL